MSAEDSSLQSTKRKRDEDKETNVALYEETQPPPPRKRARASEVKQQYPINSVMRGHGFMFDEFYIVVGHRKSGTPLVKQTNFVRVDESKTVYRLTPDLRETHGPVLMATRSPRNGDLLIPTKDVNKKNVRLSMWNGAPVRKEFKEKSTTDALFACTSS